MPLLDTSHSAAAGNLSRSLLRLVGSVLSCTLQCATIGSRENGGSVACEAEVGTRIMDVGAPRLVLLERFVPVGVHAHSGDREVVHCMRTLEYVVAVSTLDVRVEDAGRQHRRAAS